VTGLAALENRPDPVSRVRDPAKRRGNLALAFVIVSLAALVAVPLIFSARTTAVRDELQTLIEPARAAADQMTTQLDREVAAIRGYRLTGADFYRERYLMALAEQETAYRELLALVTRLGPRADTLVNNLNTAAARWQASHQRFLAGEDIRDPIPGPIGTREDEYDAVVAAGAALEEHLRLLTNGLRRQIQAEVRSGAILSAMLALLALAAASVVVRMSRRTAEISAETARLFADSQQLTTRLELTVAQLRQRTTEAEAEIEERHRAERALHAEEERFRALADNIPQLAWMADGEGSVFWFNKRWYDYTGTSPTEVAGWGWRAVHHPNHVDGVVAGFQSAIREQRHWEDTFPLRDRMGNYRWFLSRAAPIRGSDGAVEIWFGTSTDVTEQLDADAERERLAREIERQRTILQSVTDNATSALIMMDSEGRSTFWNPAAERMTGYSADEVAGRSLHELIHHTHPDGTPFPREECPIDRALPLGAAVQGHEDVFIRKSGAFFPVVCAAKPIIDGDLPVGTVIEVRDVTREKEAAEVLHAARERAEAADLAKSQFLATMSHELRTPLNAILGFAELLQLGIPEPIAVGARVQADRIHESGLHLLGIIEAILTFSKLEAEQEEVQEESVKLPELIRAVIGMTEPLAARKGLRLVVELDGSPEMLRTDAQKLKQILINLLGNAVKFTDRGSVHLRVRSENGNVVLTVRDTGRGIAPEHLGRVFEPFWQVDQSHTRSIGGTGLGLTVSLSLARLLGGDLAASSVLGEGSTFELVLPVGRKYLAAPNLERGAAATSPEVA
jgi:PAS domain S-box-containing protein